MPATLPAATFFQRLSAWALDTSLSSLPASALAYVATSGSRHALAGQRDAALADPQAALAYFQALLGLYARLGAWTVVFMVLIYGAGSVVAEGSFHQATWGKRMAGISVAGMPGHDEGYRRVALRFAAGVLSWATLNLGHALVRWRSDGRALHDLVAGMRVVAEPMPAARRMQGLAACWAVWLVANIALVALWPSDPVLAGLIDQARQGLGSIP